MKQVYKHGIKTLVTLVAVSSMLITACRKTDYPVVSSPAYLRVFNCLTYNITIANKDAPQPFLTMLIDPELDASGVPVKAATTFDFLDTRGPLARPYPDAGNTALWQKEYPGTAKMPVGPIVNGFDLSGYAQIMSGTHRFLFVTRPRSNDPYYSLNADLRSHVLVDTTITLTAGETYTMNVLEESVYTRKVVTYLRQEQFTKIPFSDSLVYVNFYNLSDEGYNQTYTYGMNTAYNRNIRDTMSVYYNLYRVQNPATGQQVLINGYKNLYMASMIRSQIPVVQPYASFPLFPDSSASHIFAGNAAQLFNIYAPGNPPEHDYGTNVESHGVYTSVSSGPGIVAVNSIVGDVRTGMVISIHSGIYNPRSFATVNTIEFINGNIYMTTLQRRYDPPIYK